MRQMKVMRVSHVFCATFFRQVYMMYCDVIYVRLAMKPAAKNEEIRWQVLKAMLDEFPSLKSKTREYLQEKETMDKCRAIS
jgi:hypothetical protein